MINQTFRRSVVALAVATYLLVVLGAAARAMGGFADFGHRAAALAVIGLGLVAAIAGGRALLRSRPGFTIGAVAIGALAVPALFGDMAAPGLSTSLAVFHPAVLAALLSTWLAVTVYVGGDAPYHSRLSMLRSQWQVPLYAAIALYGVVILGTYLRSLGPAAECHGWLLCTGQLPAGVLGAHLLQRFAALLAAGMLVYTAAYVCRRHQSRPVLLVLTGIAIVLFTVEVLLGADAARGTLTALAAVTHLAIAAALIGTLVATSATGYFAPSLPTVAGGSVAVAVGGLSSRPWREVAKDYFSLTKPRLVLLLLVTGYAAMGVAAKGFPDFGLSLITTLGLFMSCGAANAINMWYDRDIDCIMKRTQKRPIPAGRLTPGQVLAFGVMTGALSFVLLAFAVNLMTALLSLAGLLFYVCIYTMWLKRSTDLNTVIGGVCGAVPPLVGWAAVTGRVDWAPVVMFLIMFMWQPPHFWALALYRNEDYRAARIPMLPVTKGERHTKWQILIWTMLIFPTVGALYWTGVVGQVYLWVALAATVIYLGANIILFREKLPQYRWARRSFFWSIYWLGFIFLAMTLGIKR